MSKFPNKYIKKGKFKLHSGELTDTFYDVNAMITSNPNFLKINDFIWKLPVIKFIGISTGGAIISSWFPYWAMIKDGELKGKIEGNYCLIDDVCTTEKSIKDAIKIIGRKPKIIFVVVDRRKKETLEIKSLYKIK